MLFSMSKQLPRLCWLYYRTINFKEQIYLFRLNILYRFKHFNSNCGNIAAKVELKFRAESFSKKMPYIYHSLGKTTKTSATNKFLPILLSAYISGLNKRKTFEIKHTNLLFFKCFPIDFAQKINVTHKPQSKGKTSPTAQKKPFGRSEQLLSTRTYTHTGFD